MTTTDSKAKAYVERLQILHLIQRAQSLLYDAAEAASPLHGWSEQWNQVRDHADATKALWHKINRAPRPTGCD